MAWKVCYINFSTSFSRKFILRSLSIFLGRVECGIPLLCSILVRSSKAYRKELFSEVVETLASSTLPF